MTTPLARARSSIEDGAGVLITTPTDLFYLTGVHLSRGTLLLTREKCSLFIDSRYTVSSDELEVFSSTRSSELHLLLTQAIQQIKGPLYFDAETMTVAMYQQIGTPLLPLPVFFQQLRRQKFPHEITAIQQSCALCEKGFCSILGRVQEGITEQELSQALKEVWFAHGADSLSFEPIIAFGKHSACPHWHPTPTPLMRGDIVLIDIGVCFQGYHSDMTRIVFFGPPDTQLLVCHKIVAEAYERAFTAAIPGTSPYDLDYLARSFIASKGYGEAFLHGLGHGVGLKIHEAPRLSPNVPHEMPLQYGDVITIEPGIYIPGRGGIRLENTIVIENTPRSLFSTSLDPVFVQ